jgi:hypothetical protein
MCHFVKQNEDPYTLVSDKLRSALGENVTDQVFLMGNKTPFHDPLFHLYSGCSAKFAAGLY